VIEVLKSATLDGGVHLVETIVAGQTALSIEELRSQYRGWSDFSRTGGLECTDVSRPEIATS
jgi:hypothetical protein